MQYDSYYHKVHNSVFCCYNHSLHPLDIHKKVKATHDELQATMLGRDGALRKLPNLKKLNKLIERKKINIKAYWPRTTNRLDSTTIKLLLEKFVKEIVSNLSKCFPDYSNEFVFGQAQVFIPENYPTVNAEVINYGKENVSKLADFCNVDRKVLVTKGKISSMK